MSGFSMTGLLIAAAIAGLAALPPRATAADDFATGGQLGTALVRGCDIFTGTVTSLGKAEPDPEDKEMTNRAVDLKVEQVLHGKALKSGATVSVVSVTRPPLIKAGDQGPWLVWRDIPVKEGQRLLIVRWAAEAQRPRYLNRPDPLALVVADEKQFGRIGTVVRRYQRYAAAGKEVARALWLLHDTLDLRDPLFTGYLLAYLREFGPGREPEAVGYSTLFLSSLLIDPRLPAAARENLASQMVGGYEFVPVASQGVVLEHLVAAAAGAERPLAEQSLFALAELCNAKADLSPYLTPERRAKVKAAYAAWLKNTGATKPKIEELARQLDAK